MCRSKQPSTELGPESKVLVLGTLNNQHRSRICKQQFQRSYESNTSLNMDSMFASAGPSSALIFSVGVLYLMDREQREVVPPPPSMGAFATLGYYVLHRQVATWFLAHSAIYLSTIVLPDVAAGQWPSLTWRECLLLAAKSWCNAVATNIGYGLRGGPRPRGAINRA